VPNMLSKLEPLFRDILDNSRLNLTRESNASNVAGWDSLAHINLISAIEQQFWVSFTLGELQELKNVGEMIDLMERKLAIR
jgi:acyl carrier protein